jgi:hypothetical protein
MELAEDPDTVRIEVSGLSQVGYGENTHMCRESSSFQNLFEVDEWRDPSGLGHEAVREV